MADNLKLKSRSNSVFKLYYHAVFLVRYRKKCITAAMLQRLEQVLRTLCLKWECELVEFGGEADHIHMLIGAYPSVEPAKLLGNLKSVSSRKIRQEYAEHLTNYFWKPYFWSRSYSVFSVGGRAPLDVLVQYIQAAG